MSGCVVVQAKVNVKSSDSIYLERGGVCRSVARTS